MSEITKEEARELACRYADEQDTDALVGLVMRLWLKQSTFRKERDELRARLAEAERRVEDLEALLDLAKQFVDMQAVAGHKTKKADALEKERDRWKTLAEGFESERNLAKHAQAVAEQDRDKTRTEIQDIWSGIRHFGGKDLMRSVQWAIPVAQKLRSEPEGAEGGTTKGTVG
jgi:chromosome segregation ATPase